MALPSSSSASLNQEQRKGYLFPFILVTSLFFFWGFVHNLDPVLIPHLRKAFTLNYLQSSLVDFSVFIAYFVMALPAGFIMRKYGYKSGILLGLLLFGLGSLLFIPAANTRVYALFLGALFIIASGLTFLETAANPYASLLGPAESSTQRLNLAQSFNGLAVVLAPVIGGEFILSGKNLSDVQKAAMTPQALDAYLASEAATVKGPYLILGAIILVVAVIFAFTKLPEVKEEKGKPSSFAHATRHKHLIWAVVAQFFYVGAQVCVTSFFINIAMKAANIDEKTASKFLGYGYGIAFVVGRFAGTFFMKYISPNKLLVIYSAINIVLSAIAIVSTGMITVYALIGVGFFMSIMFPTIFALGIKGLGADTKIGSSLIIMSIVGGALIPLGMGRIADITHNIQNGYIIPLICFIVVLFFGWKGYKTNAA
ncbi:MULTISPECIES: L-fucose:H+ symporter permease [Niastella]|uniref:L-fucose:H+ symporter permease n=1 Tax=Niastella soli TaxID=2821487 RepID=A0ABS3YQE0_9BACT|nr:L-fucose:H+ symporter permease [Niastella soli]MBO9200090.1 L-fucose:H+ symporter permease [Niastella soli]